MPSDGTVAVTARPSPHPGPERAVPTPSLGSWEPDPSPALDWRVGSSFQMQKAGKQAGCSPWRKSELGCGVTVPGPHASPVWLLHHGEWLSTPTPTPSHWCVVTRHQAVLTEALDDQQAHLYHTPSPNHDHPPPRAVLGNAV